MYILLKEGLRTCYTVHMNFENFPKQHDGGNTQESPTQRLEDFSSATRDLLEGIYEKDSRQEGVNLFINNPLVKRIEDAASPEERRLFVKSFLENLRDFSKDIFFSEDYDREKEGDFHNRMYRGFFSSSPDITEYLKSDFFEYVNELGKMRDCGLLEYTNSSAAGEISLSIDRIAMENFSERFGNLSVDEKLSFIALTPFFHFLEKIIYTYI